MFMTPEIDKTLWKPRLARTLLMMGGAALLALLALDVS